MENVNNKNKKLTIIVGALLLVVGISFAYFIATTLINGKGSSVVGTTARIKGAEINIEGTLEFNDTDVYPGHKNVSAIKVTATGNNQLIPYNLIWKGESGISQINFTVYKSATSLNVTTNCTKKTGVQNGMQVLSEECTIINIDTLGEAIASGSISKGDTRDILAQDEFITALNNGSTVYYYVVLEYPNLDEDQSNDANATFQGEVTVEESNKEADINILAVYVADDNGNYQETTDIPQSGYQLNSEKSTCSNGSIPTWTSERLLIANLTKSGTSCYLYFDKSKSINDIIATLNAKSETPDFSQVAITDEGVYAVEDGIYGGTSYYWRGAVDNNYVKFANLCWRIVRINGDETIRLIYDGETCHANGTGTTDSIAVVGEIYNEKYNQSEYVGYTYIEGLQRPNNNVTATASNLKNQTESWYTTNIANKGYEAKVAIGKFCNDRRTENNIAWVSVGETQKYQANIRLKNSKPLLNCETEDVYNLKVGSITVDEVIMAGGKNVTNKFYYLYNGQSYWTISPSDFTYEQYIKSSKVFRVNSSGLIDPWTVNDYSPSPNIRPVINLKADVTFFSGNGTLDTPFVVD